MECLHVNGHVVIKAWEGVTCKLAVLALRLFRNFLPTE